MLTITSYDDYGKCVDLLEEMEYILHLTESEAGKVPVTKKKEDMAHWVFHKYGEVLKGQRVNFSFLSEDDVLVGYISYTPFCIISICVKPEYQGKKYGLILCQHAHDWMLARGQTQSSVCILAQRLPELGNFYKKVGYTQVHPDDIPAIGDPDITLRMLINPNLRGV